MKNQYFGDTRDLFKYDLILEILTKIDSLNHFTFVPMLTPNDSTRDGTRTKYSERNAGIRRSELVSFLQECIKEGRRNIKELERFFRESKIAKGLSITIYKGDEYFSHQKREEYFAGIDDSLLTSSLIEVDQDTGLEVKSMRGKEEKYLKYEEVKFLYERMSEDSILMIWQFIPRVKRDLYFRKISKKLEKTVGSPPLFVSDNQVVFFFLTKSEALQHSLKDVLSAYSKSYELLTGFSPSAW
jgi:hypothetical protein